MAYLTESIRNHYIDAHGNRKFLVKWQGYSDTENSWEPEENFCDDNEILNDYLKSNKLNKQATGGGELQENTENISNNSNYVTMTRVLKYIRSYTKNCTAYRNGPEIQEYIGQDLKEGAITIALHQKHFYILYKKPLFTYIADGQNYCSQATSELSQQFNTKLKPIRHNQQIGIDHCASTAITIALELTRLAKKGIKDDLHTIEIPIKLRNQLISRLHRQPSSKLNLRATIAERNGTQHRCNKCNKRMKTKQAQSSHERLCKAINHSTNIV